MKKIFYVACREFKSTVMTKSFVFGMLITPVMISLVAVVFPRMINRTPPRIEGQLAIVDPTGQVADGFREYMKPDRFAERAREAKRKATEAVPKKLSTVASSPEAKRAIQKSFDAALLVAPRLDIVSVDPSSDIEEAKSLLKEEPGGERAASRKRLALVVVHPDAAKRTAGNPRFGSYDIFVRGKTDDRLIDEIRGGMREAIVAARLKQSGLDPKEIELMTKVDRPESRTVTAKGEGETSETLNMMLPAGFMILLLMSVMTGGQYLLTTTVEEKTNRVVEVLLSAVSAMELMVGKILGQLTVGFLVLALYACLGMATLMSFAMLGLVDPVLIVYLVIFYLLAYFAIASFMAAVGAAVNEIREAQALMAPVMLVIMVPWLLWLPISREPNSMLATVLSFVPPLGNFVMLLRMASTSPPPMWQTWLSIGVGAVGVYASVWFAAKVFRVGLLMYGKPPNLQTLVRWARMS
jgi:ABC-2 type transport system permease protein